MQTTDSRRRRLILWTVMVESFLHPLNSSIAAVTLPRMQGAFSATQDEISIVVTAYLVAVVAMVPLTSVLTGWLGRRRLLLIAVSGFVVTAFLSGVSDSLVGVIVARFMQGVFGAVLVPVGQATLLDTHPREEMSTTLGLLGMGQVFGLVLGPVVAGYATEYQSWRWAFFFNLPIGILALIMVYLFLPEGAQRRRSRISFFGYSMLAISMAAFQLMLSRGGRLDWFESTEIVVSAGIAAACFYVFLVHTFTARRPFFDPRMFRDRNFTIGLVLSFVFVWLMLAFLVLLPAFLQDLRRYPTETAGMVMAIRGAASMPASVISGLLIRFIEKRLVIAFGFLLIAVGCWQISGFTPSVDPGDILIAAIIFGMGSGFGFIPINVLAFDTLPVRYRPDGTSIFSLVQSIGGSLGVSVMVTKLVREAQANHSVIAGHVTPYVESERHMPIPDAWDLGRTSGLAALDDEISRQALMIAYVNSFQTLALLTAGCVALAFFMQKEEARPPKNA
ncbi:MAG: DHA2 family efflux MFS transporter permease subunit [Rhodospirillales bacterium]|nr:DHA2 family efflux MFS transporter permease subunit [Rhodospirillales bacterium]